MLLRLWHIQNQEFGQCFPKMIETQSSDINFSIDIRDFGQQNAVFCLNLFLSGVNTAHRVVYRHTRWANSGLHLMVFHPVQIIVILGNSHAAALMYFVS